MEGYQFKWGIIYGKNEHLSPIHFYKSILFRLNFGLHSFTTLPFELYKNKIYIDLLRVSELFTVFHSWDRVLKVDINLAHILIVRVAKTEEYGQSFLEEHNKPIHLEITFKMYFKRYSIDR